MTEYQLRDGGGTQSSVASFVANLPELLGSHFGRAQAHVTIVELSDDRYIQFWLHGNDVIAEIASNRFARSAALLSEREEMELAAAGWEAPSSNSLPNWRRAAVGIGAVRDVTEHVAMAVLDILRLRSKVDTSVWVRSFTPQAPVPLPPSTPDLGTCCSQCTNADVA